MMFCPNCRLKSYEDTEHCTKCGVKLENMTSDINPKEGVQYPHCGNNSKLHKCKHCSQ